MTASMRRKVGSESQSYVGISVLTGIQRVMRETHVHLMDLMAIRDVDLVPLATRNPINPGQRSRLDYLRADPLTSRPMASLADVDAVLMLDLNVAVDFGALYRMRRERRLPTICMVHDVMPLNNPEWWPQGAASTFRIYLQQLVRVADHIVVPSQKVRDDLAALPWSISAEVHVIALGSSFLPRAPSHPPDQRVSLMYVSTIEPRKGHEVLLTAFDTLLSAGVDVDLTLVGREGWESEDLFVRIRNHSDFGGRLKWVRNADDLDIEVIARACTIGVVPAKDEGFGLFVEEGLSLGLKVVASDTRVFRDRAQANLSFAGPRPQDWANAVLAAHARPWQPPIASGIRSMADFATDVAALVADALE